MLPVRAFGQEMWHEFHVVSNLNTDAIVGIDFINAHHLSYDGKTRMLNVNHGALDHRQGQLRTTREFYLPSGQATNISVHSVSVNMPPGSHILTTTGTAKYPALVGQPGLCQMSQNLSCKLRYQVNIAKDNIARDNIAWDNIAPGHNCARTQLH